MMIPLEFFSRPPTTHTILYKLPSNPQPPHTIISGIALSVFYYIFEEITVIKLALLSTLKQSHK